MITKTTPTPMTMKSMAPLLANSAFPSALTALAVYILEPATTWSTGLFLFIAMTTANLIIKGSTWFEKRKAYVQGLEAGIALGRIMNSLALAESATGTFTSEWAEVSMTKTSDPKAQFSIVSTAAVGVAP